MFIESPLSNILFTGVFLTYFASFWIPLGVEALNDSCSDVLNERSIENIIWVIITPLIILCTYFLFFKIFVSYYYPPIHIMKRLLNRCGVERMKHILFHIILPQFVYSTLVFCVGMIIMYYVGTPHNLNFLEILSCTVITEFLYFFKFKNEIKQKIDKIEKFSPQVQEWHVSL